MRWKPVNRLDVKASSLVYCYRTDVLTRFNQHAWQKKPTRWVYVSTVHLTGRETHLKPLKTLSRSVVNEFSLQVSSQPPCSALRSSGTWCCNLREEYRLCPDPAFAQQIFQT